MSGKIAFMFKIMAFITLIVLALVSILYVLDVFTGEYAKELALKVVTVMGIVSVLCLGVVGLTTKRS